MFQRKLLKKFHFYFTLVAVTVLLLVFRVDLQSSHRDILSYEPSENRLEEKEKKKENSISKSHSNIEDKDNSKAMVNLGNNNNYFYQLLKGTTELAADDPKLVEYVRKYILIPPSDLPYNLENPDKDTWDQGQGYLIYGPLKQSSGFFVEAGAFNGESLSNSLHLEKHLNWTGLLVEANTKEFDILKSKNRKAWCANACLSTKPYPMQVSFNMNGSGGKIIKIPHIKGVKEYGRSQIQCVPLLTLMLALNRTTIDYFSLDVEGDELNVLKTIPFDQLEIKFLSVEVNHVPEGMQAVVEYMKMHNYKVHATYTHTTKPLDVMFIK